MKKIEIKIIKLILKAQKANEIAHMGYRSYYGIKQANVQLAVNLINKTAHCAIIYKIEEAPDQNGFSSTIRYFEWKEPSLKGKRVQFSFHNPREKGGSHGTKTIFWTKKRGEREALRILLWEKYFPERRNICKK